MKFRRQVAICVMAMFLGAGELMGGPSISSFTPTFGAAIDPQYITIHGSGFWPSTSLIVEFNGVRDYSAALTWEGGEYVIKAQVPPSAPYIQSNPIHVVVDGQSTWSTEDFTVIGPGPYIAGFTPSSGGDGQWVTNSGAHFDNGLTVRFNGVAGQIMLHNSYTNVVVKAPTGVTTGPISATTALGTYTTTTNFHAPPSISGLSPGAGRRGTNVTITGTSLLDTSAVRFGALDASSFNVLSNGAIQAVVPIGATSSLVRVIAPAGSSFSSGNFVVRPTITNFSPTIGRMGTNVTVRGENLFGATAVKFNNTSATFSNVTYGQLTATVPSGATTGFISVTTTNGGHTNENYFYLPPRIISFTPGKITPNTTTTVKISGENFIGASYVSFGGAGVDFTVTNNTTIGATVPANVTTGPISVTAPAGTTNSSELFYGTPVITSFNPTHGLPGTSVTISGVNFLGTTNVSFGDTRALNFAATNNNTITAIVPTNAQTGPITIIAPGGTNTSTDVFVLDYTADLAATVADVPDPVTMTSNLTYTIVVTNRGPYSAPDVTLSEVLPASVVLKSAVASAGSLNTSGNPITGNFGDMNVSNSVIVTLVVTPQTAGTISNFASVGSLYPDPDPANNAATTFTTVEPFRLLSIRLFNTNNVQIAWPSALTSFNLQSKQSLAANVFWSNVTTTPQIIGDEKVVTESNVTGIKYYRLKK